MLTRLKKLDNSFGQLMSRKRIYVLILALLTVSVVHLGAYALKDGHAKVVYFGQAASGSSQNEMAATAVNQLGTLNIATNEKVVSRSAATFGVSFDSTVVQQQIRNAWSWDHLVPIWGTKKLFDQHNITPSYKIDEETLLDASVQLAQDLYVEPMNASLLLENEWLVVSSDTPGVRFSSDGVSNAIRDHYHGNVSSREVVVNGEEIQPSVTTTQLETVAERYRAIAGKSLTVLIDDQTFHVSPDELIGLIDLQADDVALIAESMSELVALWSQDIAVTPGITHVTYEDDLEVSREVGVIGRFIDVDTATNVLEEWMKDPAEDSVAIQVTLVQPKVTETRTYTDSSLGLQRMIENWDNAHAGSYYVSVAEIDGQGRSAGINANVPVIMASTYKVFLSTVAYTLIENNELSASTIIDGGKSVEQCIEGGIVQSENTCMVALGWHIGWDKVDDTLVTLGFSGVRLNNYHSDGSFDGDKTATAADQTRFLTQLAGGSLINTAHTNSLLSYMKSQIYRDGIPAGANGSVVADKVGFLYAYKHDMGVVYGSSSTYVVTILTNNSSWGLIRDLASNVHELLN